MALDFLDYCRLAKALVLRKPMFHFIYFITARCNLRCKMCFYWEELEAEKARELGLEEVESLAKTMPPFFWLQLSGGEPFIREDIADICRVFSVRKKVKYITIPTNGFLTDKILHNTKVILDENPGVNLNVSLSINGISSEHDDITGTNGSFERLMKTARSLNEYRARYGNFALGIIVTQSKLNETRLKDTLLWIKDNMEFDNLTLNLARGNARQKECVDTNPDIYLECSQWLKEQYGTGKFGWKRNPIGGMLSLKDVIMRETIHRTVKENRLQFKCFAGRLSFVMSPYGDVSPCELLDEKIGNIRELNYDFKKILRSTRLKEVVDNIARTGCFCTHECFLATNILFSHSFYARVIKETFQGEK